LNGLTGVWHRSTVISRRRADFAEHVSDVNYFASTPRVLIVPKCVHFLFWSAHTRSGAGRCHYSRTDRFCGRRHI